ncbi:response regulator transcription factor [Pseudomonas sp. TNT11]|uniref:Response regulator transcription factor n=1 Tax=Pseudomonas emilianonis TaxID=2915812 RepID=A0ABT0ER06_9PSED|nr:response regulator transcription factor [Pseudomonas emilianonis]MCK1788167.1 response regulator transcription factor [Pseudomonas emilianonis]
MSQTATILVIDDEPQIRKFLRISLASQGYKVIEAGSGNEGLAQAALSKPDLLVLDLGLPDMDGQQVLREFREWSTVPVLVLSVRASEVQKVEALDGGANDYVTKPCEPRVLLARVRTLLRRSSLSEPQVVNDQIVIGNLCIDLSERTVTWREQAVELSSGEYNLLVVLARHAGEVLSRDQILQRLRGIEFNGTDRSVDVAISKLRRKFDDHAGEARKIKTVWGKGYLFSRSEWEC